MKNIKNKSCRVLGHITDKVPNSWKPLNKHGLHVGHSMLQNMVSCLLALRGALVWQAVQTWTRLTRKPPETEDVPNPKAVGLLGRAQMNGHKALVRHSKRGPTIRRDLDQRTSRGIGLRDIAILSWNGPGATIYPQNPQKKSCKYLLCI